MPKKVACEGSQSGSPAGSASVMPKKEACKGSQSGSLAGSGSKASKLLKKEACESSQSGSPAGNGSNASAMPQGKGAFRKWAAREAREHAAKQLAEIGPFKGSGMSRATWQRCQDRYTHLAKHGVYPSSGKSV